MKKLVAIILFLSFAFNSYSQEFADTIELNEYIRDTIKDRRPDRINALQVQKALLGLSKFLGTASIDLNSLHADVRFNSDSTKYIYYNVHGDPIDSTTFPHTDIYTDGGLIQRDTLTGAIVLAAGRLDSIWLSEDSIWEHHLYMSGAHDSTKRIVVDESGGSSGSAVSSGNYTSTTTGTFNVASTDATITLRWTKIDGHVHASGWGTLQPEFVGATTLSLTLPSATSFTSGMPLGLATVAENAGSAFAPCIVTTVNSTTVELKFIATYATTGSYFITLDYPE